MAARDPRTLQSSATSAQIRDAKGLALELKNLVKRREPWDRDVDFQRESLRKAYLRIIFSPSLASGSTTHLGRTPSTLSSSSATKQQLDILNLLWLDTAHALIQSYRARLAELDKQIAAAPKAHRSKGRSGAGTGGGGGEVQSAAVGPVARRKLVHSFRQFLSKEEDFWRTLCGRLASRLYPEEADELRAVGIVRSSFLSSSDGDSRDGLPNAASSSEVPFDQLDEDERRARRAAVLPLAHKALICFGDLARYSELYNESSVAPAAASAGGKKGGGKRGGKGGPGGAQDKRVKTYTKAAECYHQARLLMPDNGNPSNQLAVLAQYTAEPVSSVYHYYRALCVRSPFTTARANLQITFSKAVTRWFAPEGGEPKGDEGDKFLSAFLVLQGILFTKERLAELPPLASRCHDLFRTVLAERIFTSDVVTRIVVASLSSVWDARMSRSASQASLARSKTGSTLAANAPTTESSSPRTNLEPECIAQLVALMTTLLSVSTSETIELYTANIQSASSSASPQSTPNPAQNISAVLRRALPSIRIVTKWLVAQLEYLSRVEARVEASERKRAQRGGTRGRTSTGEGEEAQRPASFGSSGETNHSSAPAGTPPGRTSLAELRGALDTLWSAHADFANAMKLAFPLERLPTQLLDHGLWLEEDVELLGFAPLRRGLKGSAAGGTTEDGGPVSAREIRRVGRDVHPNEEQLMRVADGQKDALILAESPLTRISLVDGAFVFIPRDQAVPGADISFEHLAPGGDAAEARDGDEDDGEMLDQVTEDDPVDRAMRIDAADKIDMDGLSDLEDDDDDEEQIVYPGSRSSSQPQVQPILPPPGLSRTTPQFQAPSASPARTAADLRQQLLSGGAHSPSSAPSLSPSSSHMGAASNAAGPSLLAPAGGGSPSLNPVHSIWTPAPAGGHAGSPLLGSSLATPAGHPAQQQQQPVTPHSFESIPNLTHGSPAAHAAGWPSAHPHLSAPPPLPPHSSSFADLPPPVAASALYGGAFAAAPAPALGQGVAAPPFPHFSSPARPPVQHLASSGGSPGLSTAFAGLHQHAGASGAPPGLSPFAAPFGAQAPAQHQQQYPQGHRDVGGWPSGYS
ncbi:hypothetical protein Rhopal_003661-T1 [Rhodotorula paludigena]|uniref:Protein SMG7 n=1 Tax=Rhodotorula paludigena TaxID=86838 RepID=A0AAV5GN27_9BASI|nr:hypothetical protein Rhopal_003661-T1 [Rhodotorula paludigena]